jgi:hypothetical protein
MNERLDAIEAALRSPEPALADEDFSTGVLARLPAQPLRGNSRRWTLAAAAALGSALTLAIAPPLETAVASLSPWSVPAAASSAVAVLAIVLVPAFVAFFAERGR